MSMFVLAKKQFMLSITVVVLVIVLIFFLIKLENYKVGSGVNVLEEEAGLVALRALKCLDSEKLNECIKTSKYGIKVVFDDGELYVNEDLYKRLEKNGDAYFTRHIFNNKPMIYVIFEK